MPWVKILYHSFHIQNNLVERERRERTCWEYSDFSKKKKISYLFSFCPLYLSQNFAVLYSAYFLFCLFRYFSLFSTHFLLLFCEHTVKHTYLQMLLCGIWRNILYNLLNPFFLQVFLLQTVFSSSTQICTHYPY